MSRWLGCSEWLGSRRQADILRLGCLCLGLVLISGCGTITTEYGQSRGAVGNTSLNGFGALRNSFENAGFTNRDVHRLTDRVGRNDVLVWLPQAAAPIGARPRAWMERWLAKGNHTLVYIVPDSGSETEYWTDAAKLAEPEQRLEYRRRIAESMNERIQWRVNRRQWSNGWFRISPLLDRQPIGKASGAWREDVDADDQLVSAGACEFEVRSLAEQTDATSNAAAGPTFVGPTGPGPPGTIFMQDDSPTRVELQTSTVLRNEMKTPLVLEFTSRNWRGSRILVVAGGSLLTNYAFTRPWNRSLASKIVQQSIPTNDSDLTCGFITTAWQPLPVSEKRPASAGASGMELLTVWPLSVITIHGVLLGFVICMMLLPVFGRPRRIVQHEQTDFRDHLDAVAALMTKSKGEDYAKSRISDYMKRMHGETSGPWVLPDPAPEIASGVAAAMQKHFRTHPEPPN